MSRDFEIKELHHDQFAQFLKSAGVKSYVEGGAQKVAGRISGYPTSVHTFAGRGRAYAMIEVGEASGVIYNRAKRAEAKSVMSGGSLVKTSKKGK